MKRHKQEFHNFINTIKDLKDKFPEVEVSKHLSGALSDYGDFWGITDKELDFAFQKYAAALEIENEIGKEDIDKIIKEGMNLDTILDDEDDEWI